MPIDFSSFPALIQEQVAQQLELKDLVSFRQSSDVADALVKNSTFAIPRTVQKVEFYRQNKVNFSTSHKYGEGDFLNYGSVSSVKFDEESIVLMGKLDNRFCQSITVFFLRNKAENNKLILPSMYHNDKLDAHELSSAVFNELLETADIKDMDAAIAPHLLTNLPEKVSKINVNSPVTDVELLQIKAEFLQIEYSQIGTPGLNAFLKEWFKGERKIKFFCTTTKKRLFTYHILEGIDCAETIYDNVFTLDNGSQVLYCCVDENVGIVKIVTDEKDLF